MLQHMAEPGAGLHPLQKASALTDAAAVLDQRGQVAHDALGEAGQLAGR
jgi:hypothetical protein